MTVVADARHLRSRSVLGRNPRAVALSCAIAISAATIASCDTGDGTDLPDPTAPTTVALPDTTPLSSTPLTSVVLPSSPSTVVLSSGDGIATTTPATLPAEDAAGDFRLFAPWVEGGRIDDRFGCVGIDVSPALSWISPPTGTAELAVSLVDESAVTDGTPVVHWVMSGISAVPGATLAEGERPAGALEALNSFGEVGYSGPCPEPGATNSYRLTLYALSQQLEVADGAPATEFLDAVATITIGSTSLTGSSSR